MIFNPNIKIGQVIDNKQLMDEFLCSGQGGMRRSKRTNTLVLISKHVASKRKIYDDKQIDGIYYYTGMGMAGDQSLDYMQNKTLAESNKNNVQLHFFEVFKDNEYTYTGRVELSDKPYEDNQIDSEGNMRKVWIFPLKLSVTNGDVHIKKADIDDSYNEQLKIASKLTLEELKNRALASSTESNVRMTSSKTYVRSAYIAEYTKRCADGICQLCNSNAPFKDRQGRPFLESHHIVWLSKGGADDYTNTVALCPNCHKRMHVLNYQDDIAKLLK